MTKSIFAKKSISWELFSKVFAIYVLIAFGLTLAQMIWEYQGQKDEILLNFEDLTTVSQIGLSEALWDTDETKLDVLLQGLMEIPSVVGLKVTESGARVAQMGLVPPDLAVRQIQTEEEWLIYKKELNYSKGADQLEGTLFLYSNRDYVLEKVKTSFFVIVVNSFIKTSTLWLIFMLFSKSLINAPLNRLKEVIESLDVRKNQLKFGIRSNGRCEIKFLEESFNNISNRLYFDIKSIYGLSAAYKKFIPHKTLDLLGKADLTYVRPGDNRKVTLKTLFLEIPLEQLPDTTSMEEQFSFFRLYSNQITPIIHGHHGTIDQHAGNSLTAIFDGSADSVVSAGIKILQKQKELNEDLTRRDFDPITTGIALHIGEVIVGTVGGENHMSSVIVGNTMKVNKALHGLTRFYGVSLIISGKIRAEMKTPGAYRMRLIDRVRFISSPQTFFLYDVYESDSEPLCQQKEDLQEKFEEAYEAFCEKRFNTAIGLFEECLDESPEDNVYALYLNRCEVMLSQEIESDWEGITIFNR